jgi:ribosomal protein S18 acetylase RimI-like enzyme
MIVITNLKEYPAFKDEILWLMWNEWQLDYNTYDIDNFESFQKEHSRLGIVFNEVLVAVSSENELIGFATLLENDLCITIPDTIFLSNLYVKASWRGVGIGTTLVQKCIEHYRQSSMTESLYLWTYEDNLMKWYEKFGFKVRDIQYNVLSHNTVYIMSFSDSKNMPSKIHPFPI